MTYTAWSVVFGEQPSASKWNQLGTNDAHFYSFLGDNLAWQAWTPTLTGVTLGNGTMAASYTKVGRTTHYRFRFVFGSTTTFAGSFVFSPPVAAVSYGASSTGFPAIGITRIEDNTTNGYFGPAVLTSTTTIGLYINRSDGTYANINAFTSTVPFTVASGDEVWSSGTYEAAS